MVGNAEPAPAKVNLFLHVTGRRADGYHLLDSLAVFADVKDWVRIAPSDRLTLTVTGPFAPALASEAAADNLVVRAAQALAAEAGLVAAGALTLEKNIPVASGIGGGSADAAAALRLLARTWRLTLDQDSLDRIAAGLGADVPVCLRGRATRMGGVGEILSPAPALPDCGLLLVNPGLPLATVAVFRARTGGFSPAAQLPPAWTSARAMAETLAESHNDLQPAAIALMPAIQQVLSAIEQTAGCRLARMSGSGATCFGLFDTPAAAAAAAAGLARPGWWCWGGGVLG